MIQTDQLRILERALDAATTRQRVIANNIANVDTPYFKSKQVVFEDILQQELDRTSRNLQAYTTNSRHIPFNDGRELGVRIVSNQNAMIQNNGNDVDIEYEMNQLAKNQIWYNGLVEFTGSYFSKLKSVIDGSGR